MEFLLATPENIRRAADALKSGEVVAYPTETVYGLGVDPFNAAALEKLYAIKQRDPQNPVLLIVAALEQLTPLVAQMSDAAKTFATELWPGPLSMLLPAAAKVPESLRGPSGKICVRQTSYPIAGALCDAFGGAIVSTSANISGQPPARRAHDVPGKGVSICIDGGELEASAPSTVFDPDTGEIVREGAIGADQIAEIKRAMCD